MFDFFYIVAFIILFFILKLIFREVTAPPVILAMVWATIMVMYVLYYKFNSPISLNSVSLVYIMGIILFSFGFGVVLQGEKFNLKIENNIKIFPDNKISSSLIFKLILILQLIILSTGLLTIISYVKIHFVSNFMLTLRIGMLTNSINLNTIFIYSATFSKILTLYIYFTYLKHKEIKREFYIQFTIALLYAFLSSGKASLFFLMIPMLFIYLTVTHQRNSKKLSNMLMIVFLFIAIFIYYAVSRNTTGNYDMSNVINSLLLYLLGGVEAFIKWANAGITYENGKNTFSLLLAILNSLGVNIEQVNLVEPSIGVLHEMSTNVYTFYKWYAQDFGVYYSLFIQFCLGIISGCIYRRMIYKKTIGSVVANALLYYPLCIQFFSDQYFSLSSTWVQFIFWGFLISHNYNRLFVYVSQNELEVI